MTLDIIAYTAVCEADARWVDQYLAEVERLGIKFLVHFDKCGINLQRKMTTHSHYAGATYEHHQPFTEKSKQGIIDLAQASPYKWMMPWDIDETWDKDAPRTLKWLQMSAYAYLMFGWINLWDNVQTIRVDPPFKCYREKLYNLKAGKWRFDSPIVNGPKLLGSDGIALRGSPHERTMDVVCLHWGLMTRELRQQHKERWDRVYSACTMNGANPYGMWDVGLDEVTYPPRLEPNPYL